MKEDRVLHFMTVEVKISYENVVQSIQQVTRVQDFSLEMAYMYSFIQFSVCPLGGRGEAVPG